MSIIQNEEILIKVGPRGELPGRCEAWDEIGCGKLRQIMVAHSSAIDSIQLGYERSNALVMSHRRGGDGDRFTSIYLDPWEKLKTISGHYGRVDSSSKIVVRSLKFVTDLATYGPFGKEEGVPFCFNFLPGLSFGGFHGYAGDGYLRAIGVYVVTSAKQHFKPEPNRYNISPEVCSAARPYGGYYRY